MKNKLRSCQRCLIKYLNMFKSDLAELVSTREFLPHHCLQLKLSILIFDPSHPPKSSGLIWEGDGISNTGSPSVIVLWRCAMVHQCTGERSTSLWARAKALWTLSSTCYCSEVQHYKAPRHRQMRPSPLWTPIQLDCFFVCLFHFGHTLPSQELICGLLQVTVWRWQTCPALPPY